jgi:hypothetical protein
LAVQQWILTNSSLCSLRYPAHSHSNSSFQARRQSRAPVLQLPSAGQLQEGVTAQGAANPATPSALTQQSPQPAHQQQLQQHRQQHSATLLLTKPGCSWLLLSWSGTNSSSSSTATPQSSSCLLHPQAPLLLPLQQQQQQQDSRTAVCLQQTEAKTHCCSAAVQHSSQTSQILKIFSKRQKTQLTCL